MTVHKWRGKSDLVKHFSAFRSRKLEIDNSVRHVICRSMDFVTHELQNVWLGPLMIGSVIVHCFFHCLNKRQKKREKKSVSSAS